MNNRKSGTVREELAAMWLTKHGVKIIEKNFRCRSGEIDLIAMDKGYLVFVEVKFRRSDKSGYPIDSLTFNKRKIICKVAEFYRISKGFSDDFPVRYDVVGILGDEITWYQNAFDHVRRGL